MKKITFCLFMFLHVYFSNAQIQVGTGTETANNLPISSCFSYSYSQQIYLGTEIGLSGTITELRLYVQSSYGATMTNSTGWTIYLGNTTKSSFGSNTDWEPTSNLTQVFSGNVIFPSEPGWMTITLDTPFIYNGTSNLIVGVDENTDGTDCTVNFAGTYLTSFKGIFHHSNSINPSPATPPVASNRTNIIPNIIFGGLTATEVPPCLALSAPVNAAQNVSSSIISWPEALFYQASYKLKVGTTSGGGEVLNNINVGSVLSYDIGPLLSSTTYYVTLTPFNSIGDAVGCTESTFTTCGTNEVLYENFDSSPTGTSVPFTSCWQKAGNGNVYVGSGSSLPSSAPNRLIMSANGAALTPKISYAILPSISNLQAETHHLKFKAYCSNAGNNRPLEIGYLTDATYAESFVLIQVVQLPGTSVASAIEFTVVPEYIPAGVTKLAFRNSAPQGTTNICIDDVIWELKPTCTDISEIQTLAFNSTSATISWEVNGAENAWQYILASSNETDPTTLLSSIENVTGYPEILLENLTPGTSYNLWIRSNCGAGSVGNWNLIPYILTTNCAPVSVFYENFDSVGTGSVSPLPDCWSRLGNTGYTYVTSGAAAPNTAPNMLRLGSSMFPPTKAVVVLPPVSNLQAGTHHLKFKAYSNTSEKAIEIGYYEVAGDPSYFVTLDLITIPFSLQGIAEDVIYIPENIPAGVESLVLRNNGTLTSYTGATIVFMDDVVWEPTLSSSNFDTKNGVAYPNPVKNTLNLNYNQTISKASIYTLLGQEVLTSTLNATHGKIDMAHLVSGTYLVKVTTEENVYTIKVVKE